MYCVVAAQSMTFWLINDRLGLGAAHALSAGLCYWSDKISPTGSADILIAWQKTFPPLFLNRLIASTRCADLV
jgi:hypothetical protein